MLLPPDVVSTPAHVHTHFAARLGDLAFLPRLGEQLWNDLLDGVERALTAAPWLADSAARAGIGRGIERLRGTARVPDALASLPGTLLHGDVHGGNMIVSAADAKTYLFDWGNTMLGPAAVDLVNGIASIDAPE